MANTIVEFDFAPGATVNIELYAANSDTIVNGAGGDAGTEETNRGGTYLATVTQALTGWHKAYATVSSTTMPIGWVHLTDDTNTYTVDRTGQPAGISLSADIAAAQTDLTQIKADLPSTITKNTALANFPFLMVLASDDITPGTSLTVTATRSIDGGAFAACANSVTEIANGWYKISLAASDLNGDTIALRFTASTANDRNITIVTQP
jgi:hypothetical protein